MMIWKPEDCAKLAARAATQLQAISSMEIYRDEDLQGELKSELENFNHE